VRTVVLLVAVLAVAGCGGGTDSSRTAHAAKAPFARCTHASRGFRACTVFGAPGERSALYWRSGSEWVVVRGPLRGTPGWWRRVFAAPDGQTLLAQWSGACEQQSTYLVSATDGSLRPVFAGYASEAIGWSATGQARIRLADQVRRGKTLVRRAGVYAVDPRTMRARLERGSAARRGC
jgi:hypothetical protein